MGEEKAPNLLVGRQSHTNTKMRHNARSGAKMPFDRVVTLFLCAEVPLLYVIGTAKVRKITQTLFINH